MNTRKPRTIVLLLTLTALAVGVSPARGIDPLVEVGKQRQAEVERRRNNISGPTAADGLFANPDWRNNMATHLAQAIEGCRYTGPIKELERKYEELKAKDPDGAATAEAYSAAQLEGAKIKMSDGARRRVGELIGTLGLLNDPRTVPLIAPALRETSPGTDQGDHGNDPPQELAATVLRALADKKVIAVADPKQSWDSAGWGKWWNENKLNFDEVPEPLRAIEEGRITKVGPFDAKQLSYEGMKKLSEASKAADAREAAAPAAPPQATPDKPAPAVATVTRSGDTSMWFPIAAASAAILLAVGIWFYSRTSRA